MKRIYRLVARLGLGLFPIALLACAMEAPAGGPPEPAASSVGAPRPVTDSPALAAAAPAAPAPSAVAPLSPLEERWGIRLLGIRWTAAGQMLDFRYRVTDPDKAVPLLDRGTKPYLIDGTTGAKLVVTSPPKAGPLRAGGPPRPETNYFVLFANPGQLVKRGGRVTVVIGEFRAEDLIVQ